MEGSREEREARLAAAEAILRDLQATLAKTHRLLEQAREALAEAKALRESLPGSNRNGPR